MSLFVVLQIVLRQSIRQNKCVQHKPHSQPEAGDEAVQGGVAVVGGSGVGEVQEAFLFLAGEMLSQPVLVLQRQCGGFVEVVSLLGTEKISFMKSIFLYSYKIDLIT